VIITIRGAEMYRHSDDPAQSPLALLIYILDMKSWTAKDNIIIFIFIFLHPIYNRI
jgi:hypothetical protein